MSAPQLAPATDTSHTSGTPDREARPPRAQPRGARGWWLPYAAAGAGLLLLTVSVLLWYAVALEEHQRWWLAEVVLAVGLLMSGLVALSGYLVQQARRRSRQLQATNFLLEGQIAQRRRAEQETIRLNRSLRALSDCNQALVHATDEQQLLQKICQVFVQQCGYLLAWVGYAEADHNKTVRVVASAGAARDYMQTGMVSWADVDRGRGPTGTAIRTARPVVCHDTLTDPSFAPWRERALERGFRSCLALPLLLDKASGFRLQAPGKAGFPLEPGACSLEPALGALSLYAPLPDAFDDEEVALLAELAQDLAFGIQTLRTRAQHDRAEERLRYLASIVEDSEDAIYSKSLDGTLVSWNRGAEKMYGYTAAEAIGRNVSFLTPPDRIDETLALLRKIAEGHTVEHYETVRLHKAGAQRHVSLTLSPLHDRQGRVVGASSIARDITARKQAEQTIRLQAEQHQTILATSSDGFWRFDTEGKLLDVNDAYCRMSGYSREELLTLHIAHIEAAESAQEVAAHIHKVMHSGFDRFESRHRKKNGEIFDVEVSVSFCRQTAQMVLFVRDITARKQAERRLYDQQFYTRSLIESSLDPLMTTDAAGVITDVNQQMELLTGCVRAELIGSQFKHYCTEPERAAEGIRRVLAERKLTDYELTVRSRDGRQTVVAYNAAIYRDWEGRVAGVFAAARDVTERKRAERQLRTASLYARNLIEASLDPLVTISKDGRIMDVNQATEAVTGVARQALIGTDFCDYFTEPEKARKGYEQVFAHGFVRDYPLAIRHHSGRVTDVLYNAVVYQDENGRTEGVFAAARDVTERKRAEEELQRYTAELARSNAELQDFASIASHDLQEPLRKVMAFGDQLKEHCGPQLDELGRDFLARMQNAAARMSSLINALLEYSRVSTRAQPFQPLDLQQIAMEVVADLETSIQEARAQVAIGALPQLVADRTQMRQLLQNLLSNAIKFHLPGATPQVWIDSRARATVTQDTEDADDKTKNKPSASSAPSLTKPAAWEIRVRDNGIGFEEKHLQRIFRPFQRLHGRSQFAGSGMGLAICRKIVARHGGTLTATSQLGQGATFLVTLPAVAEERKTPWNHPQNKPAFSPVKERDEEYASSSPKTMTTITS